MKQKDMSIVDIKKGYAKKCFNVKEIVQEYLKRIELLDGKINTFVTICSDTAIKEAEEIDKRLSRGEDIGLLGGIPIAVQDNICTKGIKTTCSSKVLEDFVPPYDATVIEKTKAAGAIIIGKTNMDEFGMGSSTETSAFKITKNPWDICKVPGGSSGGSAAALAAGFAPLTIGSDTGGSIRQSASFCGAVGLKPTYGMVSRYGLIAFASSLEQIGPITRSVQDSAYAYSVMQGYDRNDSMSIIDKKNISNDNSFKSRYSLYQEAMLKGVKGLRIGLPKECFQVNLNSEIRESIENSIRILEVMGAKVDEVSLPILDSSLFAYYIISSAEASSNLARYDGIRYGYRTECFENIDELIVNSRTESFGKEVKRRIILGTYVISSGNYDAYYKKAIKLRQKIKHVFHNTFETYDLLLMPTSPVLPFGIGEKIDDPLEMYLSDIYTAVVNIAGVPAISIPSGISKAGLPIGLQLISKQAMEHNLFQSAYALERELDFKSNVVNLEQL